MISLKQDGHLLCDKHGAMSSDLGSITMDRVEVNRLSESQGLEEGLLCPGGAGNENQSEVSNGNKPSLISRLLGMRSDPAKSSSGSSEIEKGKPVKRSQKQDERGVSVGKRNITTEEAFDNIQLQLETMEALRKKAWTMDKKLHQLRNAKRYLEEHSEDLNKLEHFKESRIRFLRQLKRKFQNLIAFFIPWEKRVKTIQGHFGAGIGSFFLFLRSLVWINFILLTFIVLFIVAPQLMTPSTASNLPEEEKHTALRLITVLDVKGYLEYSFLFYGYYGNEDIQVGVVAYPLPLAYCVVFMGVYLFSIITVLRAITREQRLVNTSGQNEQYPFGWRVFSAWDFLITERETAENKLASLTTAIREQIVEAVEKGKTTNKKTLIARRVTANTMVLGVLSASAYLIYLVVKRSDDREREGRPPTVWEQYEISLAITGMNAVCPVFFKLISVLEQYHPRVALYWELSRIMILYLGNMYVLVISLLNKINKTKESSFVTSMPNEGPNTTATPIVPMETINSTAECWETTVGQELFKLTAIDLVALIFSVISGDLLVALTVRFLNCFQGRLMDLENLLGYPEFKLAENVLQLINSQGLIWMGLVFSPGLIMLNTLKLVIIMYIRSWAVMVTNVPPKRIFKASHQFYLLLLLVMLFLCLLAVGYAVVEIEPSKGCGPFRGQSKMYSVLTDAINNGPALLDTVFDYLSGPSAIIPGFITMAIAIYYYRSKANHFQRTNRELRLQLKYERTEDRKKVFQMASDRIGNRATTQDGYHDQQERSPRARVDQSAKPLRGGLDSSRSPYQLPSGVSRSNQPPHQKVFPIVTYDGVVDKSSAKIAASAFPVNVLVHRTRRSPEPSTVSRVHSRDRRKSSSRRKRSSRDHTLESQTRNSDTASACLTVGDDVTATANAGASTIVHREEKQFSHREYVHLESMNVDNISVCSYTTEIEYRKVGGSLAELFS